MKKQILLNSSGSSFVEILISLIILLTGMAATSSLYLNQKRAMKTSISKVRLNGLREKIHSLIMTDSSWTLIQATTLNPEMGCISTNSCPNTFQLLRVSDNNYGIQYNPDTNPNHGVSVAGEICSSYPSESCPWRMTLQWKTYCTTSCGGSLGSYLIQVSASFQSSNSKFPIDEFDQVVIRPYLDLDPPTIINMSFEKTLYPINQAEAYMAYLDTSKMIKILAKPTPTKAMPFSICFEPSNSSENYMWPAIAGTDIISFGCFSLTTQPGVSEYYQSYNIYEYGSLPKPAANWLLNYMGSGGFYYTARLVGADSGMTTGGITMTQIAIFQRDNYVQLSSVKKYSLGPNTFWLEIKGRNMRGINNLASLRNSKNEPICFQDLTIPGVPGGYFTVSCPLALPNATVGDSVFLLPEPMDKMIPSNSVQLE